MKFILPLLFLTLLIPSEGYAQSQFELEPAQSMLMTGKGEGQDGAINPYYGKTCYAIVENIGESDFSIRIEANGELIKTIPIAAKETKQVRLRKDQQLYFDGNDKEKVKTRLNFKKIEG